MLRSLVGSEMCIRDRSTGVPASAMMRSIIAAPEHKAPALPPSISRSEVCPSLVKTYVRLGGHHNPELFAPGKEPSEDLVQIHTWPDATFRELTSLLKETSDLVRRRDAKLSFAFVYPNKRGVMVMKQVASVLSARRGEDDDKQLRTLRWQPGDILDVAVFVRNERMQDGR
eukprot:TRINITY_DN355_c0_g1_i3.p1 TRINITY_DN355_c0_g1~~TRINITY_DN355_c0_g1_i3.p1  ORF type:complete len:171 (+),score=17.36 TRINITY_DN355_c0_g1_i3:179-691(+)